MDGTSNVYGVKELSLSVDGEEIFHSYLDRFSFDDTRYLNAFVDYETWWNKRTFYTKTFVEPGNRLPFITSKNRGVINIDEPRVYRAVFRLTDAFGNTSRFTLLINGKKQPIPSSNAPVSTLFYWNSENRFGAKGIRLYIPLGSLYSHLAFRHHSEIDPSFLSAVHTLHPTPVPLHRPAQVSLFLLHDTLAAKNSYGIVSLRKNRPTWVGGTYRDGWIDAEISELGRYAVISDTKAPNIVPLDSSQWIARETITFRMTDNLSGIATYRGEIDGQYVLFERDGKKSQIRYVFDPQRLTRGKHTLFLTVTDRCGNQSVYRTVFIR
jgi:hypothetical protein